MLPSGQGREATVVFFALVLYSITTLISMAVMSIGVGILLAVTAWICFGRIRSNLNDSWVIRLFTSSVLLALACIVSLILAQVNPLEYAGKAARIDLLSDTLKTWYLFFPFLLLLLFSQLKESRQRQVLQTWIFAAGVLSVVAVIQFYTGFPRHQGIPMLPGRFHASLFFGHHLSTASILIFPFFVALSLSISRVSAAGEYWKRRLIFWVSVLIGVALFLTWSRMLWISIPIGLFVWCFRMLKKFQIVGVGLLLFGMSLGLSQVPAIRDRIFSEMGTSERVELWKANWDFFLKRPVLGIGWRKSEGLMGHYFEEKYPRDWSQRFVGHAHNNLLEMLSGVGLVGTLLWMYWNYLIFSMAIRSSRRTDIWGDVSWGIFCAWIVLHLNGLTQANFWEGKVLHQMMWSIGLLLLCGVPRSKQREVSPLFRTP